MMGWWDGVTVRRFGRGSVLGAVQRPKYKVILNFRFLVFDYRSLSHRPTDFCGSELRLATRA